MKFPTIQLQLVGQIICWTGYQEYGFLVEDIFNALVQIAIIAWTVRNPIKAEAHEKLDDINEESMYTSPHQLQETSPTYTAWQKYTKDDFEGFLTCRAREFKKNGILALVLSSRPNCLEGILLFKAIKWNSYLTLISKWQRIMGLLEWNKNKIIQKWNYK